MLYDRIRNQKDKRVTMAGLPTLKRFFFSKTAEEDSVTFFRKNHKIV